jgi:hypothetical protein
MTRRLRAIVVAVVGTGCVFGASFGVLELGLKSPSAADRVALRVLAELERTRGVHAVLDIEGHRLLSTCHSYLGRDLLQLSDGTRLIVVGVHAFRTLPPGGSLIDAVSDRRELFVVHSPSRLVGAQAAIAGSHAFWARVLAVRLEQANVHVHATEFRSRPAYELRLSTRPLLELVVDKATLRPVAAVYRSQGIDASSRLLASRHADRGC